MRPCRHHVAKACTQELADDFAYLFLVEVRSWRTSRIEDEVHKIIAVMSTTRRRLATEVRHEATDRYPFDFRVPEPPIEISTCERGVPVLHEFDRRLRPDQLGVVVHFRRSFSKVKLAIPVAGIIEHSAEISSVRLVNVTYQHDLKICLRVPFDQLIDALERALGIAAMHLRFRVGVNVLGINNEKRGLHSDFLHSVVSQSTHMAPAE